MCVFGDDEENPTLTSFDGEFEGLSLRGGKNVRELRKVKHPRVNLHCNLENKFDDIPLPQASIDRIQDRIPEYITDLDPESRRVDKEHLKHFLEHYEDSLFNTEEKIPDYLVIDNFLEHFGLSKEEMEGALNEVYSLSKGVWQPQYKTR